MSWAAQRRFTYVTGFVLFLLLVIGGPIAYKIISIPETCTDGIQNHGETMVDKGGPCAVLDERTLQPLSVMWARSFPGRGGLYNAVAYIRNTNRDAGIERVAYTFSFYDSENLIIGERTGTTFIMPGTITPVFEAGIDAGHRVIARTLLEITEEPTWKRSRDTSSVLVIGSPQVDQSSGVPRIASAVRNTSFDPIVDVEFVAVVFDPSGNAMQASGSALDRLGPEESRTITFTWPSAFPSAIGRIDVLPVVAPMVATDGMR